MDYNGKAKEDFDRWVRKKQEKEEENRRIKEIFDESEICSSLKQRERNYCWTREYLLANLDNGRQQVDIAGEPALQNYLVCIEIEKLVATRALDNVVKLWRYVEETVNSKLILIIQIFSPRFDRDDTGGRRKIEAVFAGEKAQKDTNGKVTYKHLEVPWPSQEETKPDKPIEEIRSLIIEEIQALIRDYQS